MADIRISHHQERAYLRDAINVYFDNNEQVSSKWKAWLNFLLEELQTDKNVISVADENNYLQNFYDLVLTAYLKDEFRRARNSPLVLNGFSYANQGYLLKGWQISSK